MRPTRSSSASAASSPPESNANFSSVTEPFEIALTAVTDEILEDDEAIPGAASLAVCSQGYDHGYMSDMEDGRCKHGEIADWCGESECMAARKGMPERVWRTTYGEVYHRKPTCAALQDGQRKAQWFGKQASTPEQVPLSVAMSAGLAECFHCFP
jgi:hypothetical protein